MRKSYPMPSPLLILLAWQALSVLISGTSVLSQLLAERDANAPAFQAALCYLSLFIVYGIQHRGKLPPLDQLHKYIFLALVDVHGNLFIVLSFRWTSITSVQLLDCFALPVVFGLSLIYLNARYKLHHYIAALICCTGLVVLVLVDTSSNEASNPVLGDVVALIGATLYGVSNFSQEYLVKSNTPASELLFILGGLGFIISAVEAVALGEVRLLSTAVRSSEGNVVLLCLLGITIAMFCLYSFIPRLLTISDAGIMNLSFLTADFWSLLAGYLVFANSFHWLYFVAFGCTLFGIVLFHAPEFINASLHSSLGEDQPLIS